MPTIRQLSKEPDPKDRIKMRIVEGPRDWRGDVYFARTAIPTLPFTWGSRTWIINYHPATKDNDVRLVMSLVHGSI